MGVNTQSLGTGEGLHLLLLAIDSDRGQLSSSVVFAQSFLNAVSVPSAGEHSNNSALTEAVQASAGSVVDQLAGSNSVGNVGGNCSTCFAAEVDALRAIGAVTEHGAAVSVVERGNVPGVGQGEGNSALSHHGIQGLDVVSSQLGAVVVHEPGVAGEGNAVDIAFSIGNGLDHGFGVAVLNLLQSSAAQLGDSASLDQLAQLVVCEHVNVSSSRGVLGHVGASVAFGANAELKGDGPLVLVGFSELIAGSLQEALLVGLVLRGAPNLQGDGHRAGGFAGFRLFATACEQADDHHACQQQCNNFLHFSFLLK